MKQNLRQILSLHQKKKLSNKDFVEAAVLVPIFSKGEDYHILFTQRSNQVAHHKGEVSFPGGKRSKSDSSLLNTALRESWEEIGLKSEDAEIIGELDDTETVTSGFIISPFVALIPYPYEFIESPYEIIDIFDVSIPDLLHQSNLKQESQIAYGKPTTVYTYEYDARVIWGATARILKQLLDILSASGTQ